MFCPVVTKPKKNETDQVKEPKETQKTNNAESEPDKGAPRISDEQNLDNLDWLNSEETEALLKANEPNYMKGITENSASGTLPQDKDGGETSRGLLSDNIINIGSQSPDDWSWDTFDNLDWKSSEDAYNNSIVAVYGPRAFEFPSGNPQHYITDVKVGNPKVSGPLDKRLILKIIKQHLGEVRACYDRGLNRVKDLKGNMTVQWIIKATGETEKVSITESTLNNKDTERCITNSIRFWRFPKPKSDAKVEVNVPFTFGAVESKK